MKHFRFMLKPWFWVLLGALLTAASALTSRYVIMDNNAKILVIRQDAARVDEIITNHWDNIARLESGGNAALLMTWHAQNNPARMLEFQSYMESLINQHGNNISRQQMHRFLTDYMAGKKSDIFNAVLGFVTKIREESVETINQKYLEKISLEEQTLRIEHTNANYANLAVFLQIIGLIMVLSKDLARRTWPA